MNNAPSWASAIRADLPILEREVHGKPLVYLDSAATSLTPEPVLSAMLDVYREHNANVHRGVHTLATEVTDRYEHARQRVAQFVGVSPSGVVFVRNATEGLNMLAHIWARPHLGPGDTLICTQMEHHANMVPWQMAAQQAGFTIEYLPVLPDGRLCMDTFTALLAKPGIKGLAITHMSNVLGTVNPIAQMSEQLKAAHPGALVIVDGAQSVPHMPVNLPALGADVLVFSGHKMLGPKAIGCVVAQPGVMDEWPPFLGGGDMIIDVTLEGATYASPPARFEAGTPAFAEAIGLGAAIDYLDALTMEAVHAWDQTLGAYCLDRLIAHRGVTVHGPQTMDQRGAVFSFAIDGLHPHDVGTILDSCGVAVRAGHHCAKPLVTSFGRPSSSRASLYMYNTAQDVDALIDAIATAQEFFGC